MGGVGGGIRCAMAAKLNAAATPSALKGNYSEANGKFAASGNGG